MRQKGADKIIVRSQIVGLMAWFLAPSPIGIVAGITAGIGEALNQLVSRRVYQRLSELREAMHARLNEIDSSKVNREWFLSEEYQTMLCEAARQVTASADRKKIAMLGNALANGGITDFSAETRKELFLQLIRDLTPQHIAVLQGLLPPKDSAVGVRTTWEIRPASVARNSDELALLQMLAANGLVTESLKPPRLRQPRFSSTLTDSEATPHHRRVHQRFAKVSCPGISTQRVRKRFSKLR